MDCRVVLVLVCARLASKSYADDRRSAQITEYAIERSPDERPHANRPRAPGAIAVVPGYERCDCAGARKQSITAGTRSGHLDVSQSSGSNSRVSELAPAWLRVQGLQPLRIRVLIRKSDFPAAVDHRRRRRRRDPPRDRASRPAGHQHDLGATRAHGRHSSVTEGSVVGRLAGCRGPAVHAERRRSTLGVGRVRVPVQARRVARTCWRRAGAGRAGPTGPERSARARAAIVFHARTRCRRAAIAPS